VGAVKEIASKVAESQKEFRRSAAERREISTHSEPGAGDEGGPSSSSGHAGSSRAFKFPEDFGSSSDDEDSDDEDASGWLASSTFRPSAAARDPQDMISENTLPDAFSPRRRGMDRRPLSEGFDDVFDPARSYEPGDDDHFEADEDLVHFQTQQPPMIPHSIPSGTLGSSKPPLVTTLNGDAAVLEGAI